MLAALGDPQDALPPVVHVAGTNGKGSLIAFLEAMIEAAGLAAHVYTSPHLVRFNERIAVRGAAIADDALTAILEECETANAGQPMARGAKRSKASVAIRRLAQELVADDNSRKVVGS